MNVIRLSWDSDTLPTALLSPTFLEKFQMVFTGHLQINLVFLYVAHMRLKSTVERDRVIKRQHSLLVDHVG